MGNPSYKELLLKYQDILTLIKTHITMGEEPLGPFRFKQVTEKLIRKRKFYERKLENWGKGNCVIIRGVKQNPIQKTDLTLREEFMMVLINTTIEEAKDFMNIQVKNKWNSVDPNTLSYKLISTKTFYKV